MEPDLRDRVVDFVRMWSEKTELATGRLVRWIGIGASKFCEWKRRYGKVNEHNGWVPRDHWLEWWEKERIVDFYVQHADEGYRRVTYMLMDADEVAASPSSVYRVLRDAGVLRRWSRKPSKKGRGFIQPLRPHEHWHTDISYLNISGTFYYMCTVLDGCSRYIVHHEIREQMRESDVELILQRATEKFPGQRPRLISDNGPQFIANDFKQFLRQKGMCHVRTSPYYPQSNGKVERVQKTLKVECVRPKCPLSLEEARRLVAEYVEYYNTCRLHSAIGYVTPAARLEGRQDQIHADREQKLAAARTRRKQQREAVSKETSRAV